MERNEFSSARLYPEETDSRSLAIELTKYSNPPGVTTNAEEKDRIIWLHVARTVMDFSEFENIALYGGNLTTHSDSRVAMEAVFKVIYDKKMKRSRDNWYVEPGTVVRCDVDTGFPDSKTVASAVFISVPQIQAAPFTENPSVKLHKGVCVPRRLHETFDPHDTSFERDKNQFFRKLDGATEDGVLWLCETWVLIVDSGQVFTYSSPRRRSALYENINIREQLSKFSNDKFVDVTVPGILQFEIPLKWCETFFKLQSCIAEQLTAAKDRIWEGKDDYRALEDFQLLDANDEPLTARTWSQHIKQLRDNRIHVKVDGIDDDDAATSVSSSVTGSVWGRSQGHHTTTSASISGQGPDEGDFFGLRKVSSHEPREAMSLPEYHPKVPPFLGWSIVETSTSTDSKKPEEQADSKGRQEESIRACLHRTEIALLEHHHPHVAHLQKTFPGLDFNPTMVQVGVENIEMQIQNLAFSKRGPNRSQSSNLDHDGLIQLYRDYLLVSIRALEAFTPKNHSSSILSFYYDALSKGIQYLKTQEVAHHSPRWVVSQEPIPVPGANYEYTTAKHVDCRRCEAGNIYNMPEEAMAHLREEHFSGNTSEARLREYLLPLTAAADARLKKELTDLLTTSRDTMMQIIKEARDIQEGVMVGDSFRQPAQGIPYALLKAFQVMVASVCSLPLLLDEVHSYYRGEALEDGAIDLELLPELEEKCQFLKTSSAEIASLLKATEKALITSQKSRKDEDIVKFFTSIKAQGLATHFVCNMLQQSVYNNSSAAELYSKYTSNLGSQILRKPSKRYIPQILSLMDEVKRLSEVTEWQRKTIKSLRTVLRPETYLKPLDNLRKTPFAIERYMIDETADNLQEQLAMYQSILEKGQQLIDMVEGITEITKDDQNRAIFVFTVVTVTFLPLSFVAAYMSMNGGPSNPDWVDTQILFWQVSAPLAVVIGIFCVVVACQTQLKTLGAWTVDHLERRGLSLGLLSKKRRDGNAASDKTNAEQSEEENS